MKAASLLENIPTEIPQEIFQDILKTDSLRIERIISKGHATPKDDWYEQSENEWVLVIQGQAQLRFEKGQQIIQMTPGMYVDIKAGVRHKVQWTNPQVETIWLAIFYS
jgi:cupin 2 domain-containing protein